MRNVWQKARSKLLNRWTKQPVDLDRPDEEPFPTRLAFGVWLVQFYNGIQYAEIFTLAAYIVRRLEGPDASEKRIGQMAGMLAGASSLAMGIGAWPWGRFSNTIGRKPIILFGNCWTACCIVLFCSAKVYWVALLARFMAGILDGSVVMTKVMVGESCRPKMQGKVMSYLSLGDAMGNIIGPVMGGLLADPCLHFLKGSAVCHPNSQLLQRPYLLPGVVTACLGFATTLLNIAFMDETLPSKRPDRSRAYRILDESEPEAFSSPQTELPNNTSATRAEDEAIDQYLSRQPLLKQQTSEVEMQAEPSHNAGESSKAVVEGSGKSKLTSSMAAEGSDLEKQELIGHSTEQVGEEEWWKNKPLLMSLVVTAWMLSIAKYNDELGPIFVSAPVSQGGLEISLDTFALPLAFAGVVVTAFAVIGYPALQSWAGLKLTCSLGLLLAIPGDLILPTAYYWKGIPVLKMGTIFVALAITKLATQTAFTSSMVIINSVGPRSQLGDVNGVRMMLAALGRASGPLLGGYLWGVSATWIVPGHHFLGFILASVALIGCFALHNSIPLHIPE